MLDGDKLSGKEAYEYILKAYEEHKHIQNEKDTMVTQTEKDAYENFKDRISMPGKPQKLTAEESKNLRKQGRI